MTSRLVDYEAVSVDDLDAKIGGALYLGVTPAFGTFTPNTGNIDARQRWLFRLVHSPRPLQEKMALFWHNHFATAYTKLHGAVGPAAAAQMLAQVPASIPRACAASSSCSARTRWDAIATSSGEVACDPAMLVWLDGRANTRLSPDENFGRELLELFTIGPGEFTEADVQAAARVFSGWNLRKVRTDPAE